MKRTPLNALGAVACAVVLSLTLAGCGSSKDSKGSTTLSSADFKSRANALCKTANDDIAEIGTKIAAATTDAETTTEFTAFTDRIEKLVSDLKALKAPADLSGDVTSMLDTVSGVVAGAKTQGPTFLSQSTDPFKEADTKAVALGLDECAGNQNDATDSSSGGTALSADEFRTQANAVCKAANTELDAITLADNASDAEADAAFSTLAGVIQGEVAALKALTPPDDLKADVDALLASVSAAAETIKEKGHLMAQETTSPFADADTRAKALGLDTCVRS